MRVGTRTLWGYFLMYLRNGKEEILNGNFIIKMLDDKTIEKVYEWDLEEG